MQLILFGASNAVMPFIKKGILAFFNVFLLLSLLVISVAAWRVHASELHIDERFDIAVINHSSTSFVAHQSASYLDVLHSTQAISTTLPLTLENSRLWLSAELRNTGFSTVPLVLNIDRLNIDDLQIYLLDDNARIIKSYRYQAGKGDYSLNKPLPAIRLAFSLNAQEHFVESNEST